MDAPGGGRRQSAEVDHDRRNPVDGAGEVDDAGQQSQPQRAPGSDVHDGHQQRHKRHPGNRGMTYLRKAEHQQQAGERSEGGRKRTHGPITV